MIKFYLFRRKIEKYILDQILLFFLSNSLFSRKIAVLDEKNILVEILRFLDQILLILDQLLIRSNYL